MTHKMQVPFEAVVIQVEEDSPCTLCNKVEELRPYGKGGKQVCFSCAMLNEDEAVKQFAGLF